MSKPNSVPVLESEYLSALMDGIEESVVATDENFIIQYWNKGAEQIFGYTPEETIGKRGTSIMRFHYPAETEAEARHILINEGQWKGKLKFTTKDKGTLLLKVSVTIIKNGCGKTIGYVGMHRNITKYDEDKSNLAIATSIMSSIDDPIFMVDRNLNIACINEQAFAQAENIYGIHYSTGDNFLFSLPPNCRTQVKDGFMRAFSGEKNSHEIAVKNTAGSCVWLQVNYFPIQDKHEIISHACCLVKDITMEKEGPGQLKNPENELKEALAKEHLFNDMKSRFVSMASHELRTPLSTILSSTFLLEKYTTTEQQANRQKHIVRIRESISHMNALVEDFLSLGRLEEGKIVVHNTVFNLKELISETIKELEAVKKPGQAAEIRHWGDLEIISDKKLLKTILINLLSNAFKFSGENKTILIETKVERNEILIHVKDEGIGISNDDQHHLFERFYRGKNAQNIQGTGLGLHIIKRYTQLLNGDIKLESNLDKGTTVVVTIKRHEDCQFINYPKSGQNR